MRSTNELEILYGARQLRSRRSTLLVGIIYVNQKPTVVWG
ncbi:hypothetical protein LINPERHAP2_LOCUS20944 [Linum perenne]